MNKGIEGDIRDYLGFDNKEGVYWYILGRVKEARQYGTLTIDDFVEVGDEQVQELADLFPQDDGEVLDEIDALADIAAPINDRIKEGTNPVYVGYWEAMRRIELKTKNIRNRISGTATEGEHE